MMKNVYFLSDAHLGSLAVPHQRMQERRLVRFLDSIKEKAAAIYLLGDMFDFWYEYRYVVPKGFTRFLGKLSELTDMGVEVHYFTGNHDIWAYEYLEKECGVILHKKPETTEMVMAWATPTSRSKSFVPSFITKCASGSSRRSIRDGVSVSDSPGQSTATSSIKRPTNPPIWEKNGNILCSLPKTI